MAGSIQDLVIAIEAVGVPEAQAAIEDLTVSVDALAVSMDRAGLAAGAAGTEAGAGGKKGLFASLTSLKSLAAGFGIYEAVKQFSSFQSQMELLHTQAGASQKEVGSLSKGVLDLAPKVGMGPNALAESLYHIVSVGLHGTNALKALKIAAEGAQVGLSGIVPTTNAVTAVMVSSGHGVHGAAKAMGELNAIVGSGDMRMEDLNKALNTGILGTAKTLGLHLKGLGAALAVLGDNNIRGAQAANRLRMGLTDIQHPSEKAEAALSRLGIPVMALAEKIQKTHTLLPMLKELKEHLDMAIMPKLGASQSDYEKAAKAYDLSPIFGSGRNSAAMLVMINELDRLHEKEQRIEVGGKTFNSSWKKTTETLKFFGDQLKALGEVILIKFGSVLSTIIKSTLLPFVQALMHGKTWALALAAGIGAIIATRAGLALVKVAVSLVAGGIRDLAAAWGVLSTAFETSGALLFFLDPIILIPAAIIAVVAALVILYIKVKAFRDAVQDTFKWIVDHWKLLVDIIFGPLGMALTTIVTHFHMIEQAAMWVFGVLKTIFNAVKPYIVGPFEEIWHGVKKVFWDIVNAAKWAVNEVKHIFDGIKNSFFGKMIGTGLHIGGSIIHGVSSAFTALTGARAGGGPVHSAGAYLVGERGPEVVYLPGGSYVQPNGGANRGGAGVGGGGNTTIVLQVDRKVLARAVMKSGLEAQSVT